MEPHTAVSLLDHRAEHAAGARPFLVDGRPGCTYADWAQRSHAVARGLRRRGIRAGDRVGLLFTHPHWEAYAAAYFGILRVGGAAVHLSAELPTAELARRIAVTEPVLLLVGPDVDVPAGARVPDATLEEVAEPSGAPVPTPPVDPDDIADILFTSGTTGPAKAFSNPHGNLAYARGPSQVGSFSAAAPMLAPMPLGTPSSAGIIGMFSLTAPAPLILCRPDDIEGMGRMIEAHRVGTAMFVPWVAMQVILHGLADRYDLSSVTTIAIASGALPSSFARRLVEAMPDASIMTAYAQGEATPAVLLNQYDPDAPLAVGRPSPVTELRLVGARGQDVADGELGEVWLRAPAPKRLYLDPHLNEVVHGDGWTRTRDLARRDGDGRIVLFDRMTDMIRTADGLVSSLEVEEVLYQHLGVAQAAVYGVPPRAEPARVEATVVPAPGAAPTAEELAAFAAARLPAHAAPARVRLTEAIERGLTGKVSKLSLACAAQEDAPS